MHQPVKDGLEEYLRGVGGQIQKAMPPEFNNHLEACSDCSAELSEFERHTKALRSLRAPDSAEPKAGFYARVMQRIEEARASSSVWSVFLEPFFARRLAVVSGVLVVLLGSYLITAERSEHHGQVVINGPVIDNTTPQERDAVLAKLVYNGE